jgi:hypothetical protein
MQNIHIYPQPGAEERWVSPPVTPIEQGNASMILRFHYHGQHGQADIDLRNVPLADGSKQFSVPANGRVDKLVDRTKLGVYDYRVEVNSVQVFARPPSDPVIIIHPPER